MMKYVFFLLLPFYLVAGEIKAIWLTWQQDPTTTMTVQWLTPPDDLDDHLMFHSLDSDGWRAATGTHAKLPYDFTDVVHRVELTGLTPNTPYEFTLPSSKKVLRFQTMPANNEVPFHFVVGGDMYCGSPEEMRKMNHEVAMQEPWFVLLGGDLAYSGSSFSFLNEDGMRWYDWLKIWSDEMVTQDGFLIPAVAVIGNHEVDGRYGQTPAQAKFFYAIFPMANGHAYRTLDFGKYMSLFLLDSGHTAAVDGEQANWLRDALSQRQNVPHKLAAYHVPAYPSVRDPGNKHSSIIRKTWVPLFDQFHLNTAFEHHDHAYKRTYKLKYNKKDKSGTLYLGDGAWSPHTARARKSTRWYVEKFESKRHFIVTYINKNERRFFAVGDNGKVFDSFTE